MRKDLKGSIVFIGLILAALIYFLIGFNERNNLLSSKNVRYTIGTIESFHYGAKTNPWFNIHMKLNGENYLTTHNIVGPLRSKKYSYIKEFYIAKRFLIKFSVEKPNYNELYLDKLIPDSLSNCNDCVWDELPQWAK